MAFKIGFTADHKRTRCEESVYQARQQTDAPHPSVVQVYFGEPGQVLDVLQ